MLDQAFVRNMEKERIIRKFFRLFKTQERGQLACFMIVCAVSAIPLALMMSKPQDIGFVFAGMIGFSGFTTLAAVARSLRKYRWWVVLSAFTSTASCLFCTIIPLWDGPNALQKSMLVCYVIVLSLVESAWYGHCLTAQQDSATRQIT